ncbi:MAG: 2-dehydropantoate 2-reductase [Comamonadaceae bacterium]|nr:MAG: 2-dehydropantoate 2-reductase [Comamonadaceae bacterium]
MKVCVFGAGAVGGHVAARLAVAGHADVSLVARGAHLAAIQANGLTLRNNEGDSWNARIAQATDKPETLPPQDVVLVALKACSLPAQAEAIGRLLAPDGVAVFLNNGIPWWWNQGSHGGEVIGSADGHLPLLDPDGALWKFVRPERALGVVINSPNEVQAPGVIYHQNKPRNRFIFGGGARLGESQQSRLAQIAALFEKSGLPAPVSSDLRREIWHKLLVNAAGNPVSALTQLDTMARAHEPAVLQLCTSLAREIAEVAGAMGWPIEETLIEEAMNVGRHQAMRPSMLQDALLKRPMETEALLGQPQLFARALGIRTPHIDMVVTLIRGLDRANLQG